MRRKKSTIKNYPTAVIRLRPSTWKKLKFFCSLTDKLLVDTISDTIEDYIDSIDLQKILKEKLTDIKKLDK